MKQHTNRFLTSVLALALLLSAAACSGGGTTTAASMHLRRTEGTVSVSDGDGKNVPVLDNLGLYSGYGVGTRSASYAWIDLDDVKLTKLDQNSEISIRKEGKSLDIEVISGSLFFNVTQPLADDETMDIHASAMLVGIRGTSGWVENRGSTARVYLLEGKVECSAGEQTVQVNAGQMAELTPDGELTVREFTDEDIPDFVQIEAEDDPPVGQGETSDPDELYMPYVAYMDAQEVLRLLQNEMGLVVDVQEEFSYTVTQGYVIRFMPTAGTLVQRNDAVTIWVSKGPDTVFLPEGDVVASGEAGENVTWSLSSDGTLVISGTGPMENYDYDGLAPWYENCCGILSLVIVIDDGVTSIGDWAFTGIGTLVSVTIPDSVTSIGEDAFSCCYALDSVTIPKSVKSIGNNAFAQCYNLTSTTIGSSVTSIGDQAFYECISLTDVYYGGSESQWNQIDFGSSNDYLLNAAIHYNS